jgi:hypothetical protein
MTYGEYRVGLSFNPSGNEHIDQIKRMAADLIDYMNSWKLGSGNPEANRLARRAIDTIDDAAMQAVKAVTKGEFNA